MILLVGLGNPGDKYAGNRHNIGFMAIDEIADRHGFSPERSKHQGILREGTIGTEKVIALKPQTFMNESGRSVAAVAQFYKLAPTDIVVFHDELDLAPGKLRMKSGGGHAGHNGLRSIHAHLGDGYRRVRLGIGHPGDKAKGSGYVLRDFAKADAGWLGPLLASLGAEAAWLAKGDDQRFQSAVAQTLAPERKSAGPKAGGKGSKIPETNAKDEAVSEGGAFSALKRLIGGS